MEKRSTAMVFKPVGRSVHLTLRFNLSLRQALNNHLAAMHHVDNYTFSSVADLLRHILTKIERGELRLNRDFAGEVKYSEMNIRVSAAQKNFWQSLPQGNKRQILERAITEFISRLQSSTNQDGTDYHRISGQLQK